MVEEDAEAMQQELKEAFRLYDKEGEFFRNLMDECYYFLIVYYWTELVI